MENKKRNIGEIRMKKMKSLARKISKMSSYDLSASFVQNSLIEGNLSNKTLDKMKRQLRSVKPNRQIQALFKVNKNLTKLVKADIRRDIREQAYNNRMLVRDMKKQYNPTFQRVVNKFDRNDFFVRHNKDLLISKAWEAEREWVSKKEGRKMRSLQLQENTYAERVVVARENEIIIREALRRKNHKK